MWGLRLDIKQTFLAAALFFIGAGCQTSSKPRGLMQTVKSPLLTERQLQVTLHDYVRRFATVIEAAADEIEAQSGDPELQRRALLWKMNAIPACQSAAFDADPVIGLVDTWALVLQMKQYFEQGAGHDVFGEWQPIASAAAEATEAQIVDIAARTVGPADFEAVKMQIEPWAQENPLRGLSFRRATISPVFAEKIDASRGLLAVAQGLEDRVDDLTDRLTIYAEALPEQARWQAQVLLEDTLGPVHGDILAAEREQVVQALAAEREAMVEALDQQRVATLGFAREERQAILSEIDGQRAATLETLQSERAAILAALDLQRVETLEALRTEREATLGWLDEQRVGITEDVRLISGELIDQSADELVEVINLEFLIGAGAALVFLLVLLVLLRLTGRASISLEFSRRDDG